MDIPRSFLNAICLYACCIIGQWYPGHIAKTEKELKNQLKLMDVVIEVRDARIPMSTSHPQVRALYEIMKLSFLELIVVMLVTMSWYSKLFSPHPFLNLCKLLSLFSCEQMDLWLGNRKRVLVLNREDMISTADRNAWATYFAREGTKVVFSNGKLGMVPVPYTRILFQLSLN